MADQKDQNSQVEDLLARLRRQMSQLDEEFGMPSTDADTENDASPTVSDASAPVKATETEQESESAPDGAQEDEDTLLEEAPADVENSPEEEAVSEEGIPDAEAASPTDEKPASPTRKQPKTLTQLDLFDTLDALLSSDEEPIPSEKAGEEEAEAEAEAETEENDGDDDIPVFSKGAVSVRIQKERIVADETLVDEDDGEKSGLIVTEVEIPTPDPLREQTETHASFFVPDSVPADDTAVTPSSSPFAPDRRFDPTRYDEMLAAYEKRKQAAEERVAAPAEEAVPPAYILPQTPILMPRVPIAVDLLLTNEEEINDTEDGDGSDAPVQEPSLASNEEETVPDVAPEAEDSPIDEPSEEPLSVQSTVEEEMPSAEASAEDAPAEEPVKTEPTAENVLVEVPPSPPPRVLVATEDLSDTERAPRTHASSGRVHLAPKAYRAKDVKTGDKENRVLDDEEDYMGGLPLGIRESLVGSPLGRPNRAQAARRETAGNEKGKKGRYRFLEEVVDPRNEDASPDYIQHHIEEEIRQTRIRLIVISILAFVLLLLENITHVTAFVPRGFVDVQTAGVVDMLLLLGVVIAAWPRLYAGAKGIRYGRILPESILLAEVLIALVYAAVFGFLGEYVKYFSFVPALGISILYSFRVFSCEEKLKTLERLNTKEEKLLLSPVAKKKMQAEMRALGAGAESSLVYRVRKTPSVKGFLRRSSTVCEDEGTNLCILLVMLAVGVVSFLLSIFAGHYALNEAFQSVLFGVFLTAPIFMCGVHVYCMHRTVAVAGEDSIIIGEASVREAVTARAIAFEDVEAAPSLGVVLSGIRVHCDDPSSVFKYLTALYGHIGGPLCGRFSGIYTDKSVAATSLVELVDATSDGVSAVVDGAEVVVGNGRYLTAAGITSVPGVTDGKLSVDARNGVLYVAVNRMVCMTFYMEHKISAAFEKNVLQLYRLGIGTILRTYDPNFNEDTVSRSAVLRDCHVRVVSKTVEERNDFYAERAEGGIATAGSTGKLLKLFLLCFRTHTLLRLGKVFKLVGAALGGAVSVLLCVLGLFHIVPSVYIALYHLFLLALYMLFVRVGIRLAGDRKEK